MGPRGKLTAIVLLSEHSNKVTPSDVLLNPQTSSSTAQPSSEKRLLTIDSSYHRRATTGQHREGKRFWSVLLPEQDVYHTPPLRAQRSVQKRGQDDCKDQR